MSRRNFIDEKLQQWLAAYDRGLDLPVDFLCQGESNVSAAELEQLRQAIDRHRQTLPQPGRVNPSPNALNPGQAIPAQIGRYRVDGKLGEGGFGTVYLGFDDRLRRQVAIKVPHGRHLTDKAIIDAYLFEAQTVAALDHPNIVPVFDVGTTEAHPYFHVSKLIAGSTLAKRAAGGILPFSDSARIVATIAEALHYAHLRSIVHRDVKPGNILIDPDGRPYLTDFGLALRDRADEVSGGYSGTPAYMSPEQARGEGHRVDGRSDLFSLGIVFYELLTGRRPFASDSPLKLLEQIAAVEPWPPREINDTVPRELERICLKALSKRVTERYTTAIDLAEELHAWGEPTAADVRSRVSVPQPPVSPESLKTGPDDPHEKLHSPLSPGSDRIYAKVVPNGLRSFNAGDADFFLELLPGPRDREGLPDSIRFWKTRIEERQPEKTFSIGLMYGPSGCGKSSLVKAGLLPQLSKHVAPVYVEASADGTERQLLRELLRLCPGASAESSLPQLFTAIRRHGGLASDQKVCIILDQFEQWLHAADGDLASTPLVQALRQCDGAGLQCLIMVRDDFWMAATRLMQMLEVPLVEGHNCHAIDLFPMRHARRVLTAFGRAFGELPEAPEPLTADQRAFVEQAVAALADHDKVICVRLSLFAEMAKSKPWTPAALRQLGGTEGVGQTFLYETFSASTSPPHHRYHETAARAVLRALLPESGTDIKGGQRSYADLLACTTYSRRPKDFQDLIQLLDGQLHLITPVDAPDHDDASGEISGNSVRNDRKYQLTHDYLVPSIRKWLLGRQLDSCRGRAELRLAELATHWSARPERRRLPALWEFGNALAFTRRRDWTSIQRQLLKAAARHYLTRSLVVLIGLGIGACAGIEWHGRATAHTLRDQLATAKTSAVPTISVEMKPYRRWINPLLRAGIDEARENRDVRKQLNFRLALLPDDPAQLAWLKTYVLNAPPDDVEVIRHAFWFRPERSEIVNSLRNAIQNERGAEEGVQQVGAETSDSPNVILPAAAMIALYDPTSIQSAAIGDRLVAELIATAPDERARWIELLQPAAGAIIAASERAAADLEKTVNDRVIAADLAHGFRNQPSAR